VYSTLPTLTDFSVATLQPDVILERKLVKKGNIAVPQVLVKWQGLPGDVRALGEVSFIIILGTGCCFSRRCDARYMS
jgi:hypothetical protein